MLQKGGSLVVSNPRCLISQIAVTFDEGDRGRCEERNRPSDRASGSASVCLCVFSLLLLMCTVQIQLCPPLLNKSSFKYKLCCLQHSSASRHQPLFAYAASVHLTLSPLLSALRTADQMHPPPGLSIAWQKTHTAACYVH